MSRSFFATPKRSGSVLVFALIALGLVLTTALSLSMVTVSGSRSSISTNESVIALQWADTGVERAFQKIYKRDEEVRDGTASHYTDLNDLGDDLNGANCVGGDRLVAPAENGADIEYFFYDGDGVLIPCDESYPLWRERLGGVKDEDGDDRDPGDPLGSIRVRATYHSTIRAIDVKVLPPALP